MPKNSQQDNLALKTACLSFIKFGVYLLLFTPLVVATGSFFPFVTPKTIYFRIIIDFILAAYLILAIYFPEYRPKFNLLSVAVLLFVGVFILTSWTGINFNRSFWSTYERMTGVLTILHLLAFFIILTSVFKKREDWNKLLAVSMLVGILICAHFLSGGHEKNRKGSKIGNSSFMATYLLFDAFFALFLLLEKKSLGWKIFSGTFLVFCVPVLFAAEARAATASFFGGLTLFGLGYLLFSEKKKLRNIGISFILIVMLAVILLGVLQPPFVKDRIAWFQRAMRPRFVVWEKAWKGFLEKPILGWGPENFNVIFLKFFNPCVFLKKCGAEVWFDRAHNIVFDTLSTMGIVGMASYLFMMGVGVLGSLAAYFKKKKKAQEGDSYYEMKLYPYLGMAVLLVSYFVQNLTVFDMISSYMIFFLSLGFIYFLMESDPVTQQIQREKRGSVWGPIYSKVGGSIISALIISAMIAVLYFANLQPYNSATYVVRMIRSDNIVGKRTAFKEALNTYMNKYEIREQFAQQMISAASERAESKEVLTSAIQLGEDEMEKSLRNNSLDFRPHLFAGRLYTSDYRVTREQTKLQAAERTLSKAIELSPTNQQGYWYMTEVELAKGNKQEAYDLFQKAIELEPELGLSYWYLGITYKLNGQYEKALENIEKAGENGYRWKTQASSLREVIDIHQRMGNLEKVVSLYEEAVELKPENATLWAALAQAYKNIGETEKAREAALKVKELDPDLSQDIDNFLENLEG